MDSELKKKVPNGDGTSVVQPEISAPENLHVNTDVKNQSNNSVPSTSSTPTTAPMSIQIPQNHHGPLQRQGSLPLSPQPMSPDPVHDLPVELLQAGWRKFWSKREQREYYFNKNTNESLWDMPPLTQSVSSISDI